jgi:hypothetical protein
MGIDGVGKGGVSGVTPETVGSAGSPEPVGAAPALDAGHRVEQASVSEALAQLRRGEIDRSRYLDVRAQAAVSHLEGRLPAEQVDVVRETLRTQLESDPVLAELVRRATAGLTLDSR